MIPTELALFLLFRQAEHSIHNQRQPTVNKMIRKTEARMILSYRDSFDEDAKRKRIKATITTEHPASIYGEPVIVLDDGRALSQISWVATVTSG